MPLSSNQLAAMVERARLRSPPVVTPSPPPKAAQRRAAPAPQTLPTPKAGRTQQTKVAAAVVPLPPIAAPPPLPSSTPQPKAAAEADDFQIGWQLQKDSWHFHRRFYAIFKRPMRPGEYSHLLRQIRRRTAEHLWEDCWRLTLPDGKTLPVRATSWRLITILPKNWQPPDVAQGPAKESV